MESILEWVKNGLLFGIFGSVILMLSPNKSYQKHIGFVVGLLFVLVMIHPLMEWLSLDESTYRSAIENYFDLEPFTVEGMENNRELYENALSLQLKAVLTDGGYHPEEVRVSLDDNGEVRAVVIRFGGEVTGLSHIESYIKNLFGQEVVIEYEN